MREGMAGSQSSGHSLAIILAEGVGFPSASSGKTHHFKLRLKVRINNISTKVKTPTTGAFTFMAGRLNRLSNSGRGLFDKVRKCVE